MNFESFKPKKLITAASLLVIMFGAQESSGQGNFSQEALKNKTEKLVEDLKSHKTEHVINDQIVYEKIQDGVEYLLIGENLIINSGDKMIMDHNHDGNPDVFVKAQISKKLPQLGSGSDFLGTLISLENDAETTGTEFSLKAPQAIDAILKKEGKDWVMVRSSGDFENLGPNEDVALKVQKGMDGLIK